MNIENLIGFPKDVVIESLKKQNVKFEIVTFDENKNFDTLLLTKFENKEDKIILFFDKFRLEI